MYNQQKFKPLSQTSFFDDHSSARQPVQGTVARGHLKDDDWTYTGRVNGKLVTSLPWPVTASMLKRGQERYDIYCSVCHGATGAGDGMVVQRGFPAPPSYHEKRLREAPVGHFFDVMTHGYGAMFSYASRVNVEDRWAIAAYIRALQRSENGRLTDVPASERNKLEAAR
jgi:mono/diheme cytochrome c family protein